MVGFSLPGFASQKTEKTFGSDDSSGDDGHALALTAAGKPTMTPKSSYWHDDPSVCHGLNTIKRETDHAQILNEYR